MNKAINIRGQDNKPKPGSYTYARNQVISASIKQIKKKSIPPKASEDTSSSKLPVGK